MKDVALTDQIMNNLAFEVEAVPQEDEQISSASNSPINVKIRIRKKNRKQFLNRGVISIPKIDRSIYKNEKIRLSNSDQTIMSFNVLMEREESITRPLPKQKRIFQLFKRGGCLGTQSDEDQYEYSIGTSKNVNKNGKVLEPMKRISSKTLETRQFTLTKNYSNLEATHGSKQKHKDILGKCKPGGCLDPPFGEDKYSYLPNLLDKELTNQNEIKIKNVECECDDTFTNNFDQKSNKKDNSALIKKEKSESLYATDTLPMYIKDTNSIITFPSISPSTEALNKHYIHKRTKSFSSSKKSKSYNVPNKLLETFYISPKIKLTNKTSKNVCDSNHHSDTGITDTVLKNQELFLEETTLETPNLNEVSDKLNNTIEQNPSSLKNVNVPLELTDGLNYNEEVIPNFAISNAIQNDNLRDVSIIFSSTSSPPVLKNPRNNMEIDPLACTEKSLIDVNALPENNVQSSILLDLDKQQTPNLEMNKLGEDNAKRENADTNTKDDIKFDDKRVTDKFDSNAEPKLLRNNYETIVKSQDHSFYTEHLSVNYLKTKDRSQGSDYSIKHMLYETNNIDNIIANDADNEKFIVKSQNNKYINYYLNKTDPASEVNLQERDQLVSKVTSLTNKESNVVTNSKKSIETIVATPQDLITKNELFEIIHEAKEINQDKKDTSNTSEESIKKQNPVEKINAKEKNEAIVETVTKSIENCVTENENNIETVNSSLHFLKVNNEKSNSFIINEGAEFPPKEIYQATNETVTKSIKNFVPENENNIETVTASPQYLTVNNKNSKIINVAAELPSTEIDQGTIETETKNIKKFKTENGNSIETVPASPDFPIFNNKNSNIRIETAELDLKEIDQVTIVTLTKSVESFIIKKNNDMEAVSVSPQYLVVNNKESNLINIAAEVPSKETEQVTVETVKKSVASLGTKNENSIETVSKLPHLLAVNNENSNIINEPEELLSKEIHQLKIVNPTKSVENIVTKNKNDTKTISASPQYHKVDTRDSNTINVDAVLSSKNVIKTLIESLLDLAVNNEDLKIVNIAEMISLNEIDIKVKMTNSSEKNIATIQKYRFSNEELKLKNVVPQIYDSTREHTIDPSNISTKSVTQNSIETMSTPQKEPSFKDEGKDFKITDGTEVNIRGTDQPILMISSSKNTDDGEPGKSFQDSLKVTGSAQVTHIDEATKPKYKIAEREDKSSEDIFQVSVLKSYKTNSIDLISTKESKVGSYSNSIKKLDFQHNNNLSNKTKSNVQNFHTDKRNLTDPDEEIKLNKEDRPITTTASKIKGVNKLHDDVSSVISNIIDEQSSTSKQQEIKTPIQPKNNIFESNNTQEERNLKHNLLKNNDEKGLIHLDMAFQSFRTDKDENFINTLDYSSFINAKRYLNDNILQFKTILRPNEGKIKIPIDTNKDLVLYVTTDRKSKYQNEQLNKTLSNVNMQLISQHKLLSSKAADKGNLFLSVHPSANDFQTVTKSIKDSDTISESNFQQILDKVYKNKLLPLYDVIKKLKDDIKDLSKQRTLIKDKLNKTNVIQLKRIHMTRNKCACIEMFFRW